MTTKQERYDYLRSINEAEGAQPIDTLTAEQVQLFFELNPEEQWWREDSPNVTPRDIWGIDTSCYE